MRSDKSRRSFLRTSVAGLAGVSAAPLVFGRSEEKMQSDKSKSVVYRTLGRTGIKVSVVSLGVMNADNPQLVRAALDGGINHLDTANVYQRGRNEEMLGEVLKDYPRESYTIATKVVGEAMDRRTGQFDPEKTTAEAFLEKLDTSLQRLKLDQVDILYNHALSTREAVLFEPLIKALEKAKKDGRTRFIGVSTHRNEPEVIRAMIESGVYDVVLTAYNFRQEHLAEMNQVIKEAAAAGLGVVAMKTQAGVFWDKEKQKPINMAAALKWALQNPDVHMAIPGMTTFDQLELDLGVMADLKMTPREIQDLREDNALAGLYCQQCTACLPQCPRNLAVPDLMQGFMYAYGYRNLEAALDLVEANPGAARACTDCGSCRVSCRLGFNVRERILDVSRLAGFPREMLA